MILNIRKTTLHDIPSVMELICQAQAYFKSQNIDQWQDGYPNGDVIKNDIQKENSYVLIDQDIIASMYFAIEDDPNYNEIDGNWLTQDQPYAIIHRIVVKDEYKGNNIAVHLLEFAINECLKYNISSIRIDTHKDNLSMQKFLEKHGFAYCGIVTLESGALRIAFEKIVD